MFKKKMIKKSKKLIHEGDFVAEVEVELIETTEGWSPYLSLSGAQKLDAVRQALRNGDLSTAGKYARIFSLTPVSL